MVNERVRAIDIRCKIDEFGYEKAVRELCKSGLCASRAEARREVHHYKIQKGEKETKS